MAKERPHKRKIWIKWLLGIVSGLFLLAFIAAVIMVFWIIPAIVRSEITRRLSTFCDGPVELEDIEVNYTGPIRLKGVVFFDKNGRDQLSAEMTRLTLANWPGLSPAVTEIEIEGLTLKFLSTDGKFTLPFISSSAQLTDSNINKVTVREAAITLINTQGSEVIYDNLMLSAIRKDNAYNVLLNQVGSTSSELFLARGRVDSRTLEVEFSLQIKHTVRKPEMALVFRALDVPTLSAEGKLAAELTITGCLKELATLQPKGTIKLEDWVLAIEDSVITNNLATAVKLDGQRFDFENFTATVCKGQVDGSFYAQIERNQPIDFAGQISAQKASLSEITAVLAGPAKKATRGTITLKCNFTAKASDLNTLKSDGLIFFDDADITILPVIPHLFAAVGLANYDPLKMSDAEVTFTMAGPVMTIKRAHIANRLAAIEAEPGGTINLQTKQIDAHIVAVPLRQVDNILKQIPVVNIIVNLKDKLTRLRVKGHWSDPPTKLISKQPIKDIKDGTVGFLKDVATTGGQFSQEMLKGFGILFQTRENKNK